MRLSDNLKRLAVSLSVSLAVTGSVAASETSYYNDKPWSVVLHAPDAEGERPYCAIRTSLWDARAISIETQIGAADVATKAIRIHKDNWKLPLNQTTSVAFSTDAVGTKVTMKAISGEELYYSFPQESFDEASMVLSTLLLHVIAARRPPPLMVRFGGNEPMWAVPALDVFQSYQLNEAFSRCDVDLRGLQANSTDGNADTSPFGGASSTANSFGRSSGAGPLQPPSSWEFYTREMDWGRTCFVQTHRGIAMVGFMGSPGKDLVGFVSSVFSGETRATWHVDDKPAYVSDGSESDHFTWHEFGQLPIELLDQVAQGTELAITSAKGERVAVSLTGAADVLSKFKACFGKH
ncbi:hypothetical protein HJA76_01265 [Rhizobium bangladeshense]|uniref:hypothetical protein n=1 Tax=Rhizobium bangladeshense TaxID=1138189 RepID=UPI001C83643A|nr:hypothetical protein [Rhizobium bangladeshense]MBX4918360.1 hypothetical protein [Rhizobium bangladeshense]